MFRGARRRLRWKRPAAGITASAKSMINTWIDDQHLDREEPSLQPRNLHSNKGFIGELFRECAPALNPRVKK
jgi:hypothetical protein